MQNYEFQMKKLFPLKDTPEKLGYKEFDDVMYLNKEGLVQVGIVTKSDNGLGRQVLKFPSNMDHIFTNVKIVAR